MCVCVSECICLFLMIVLTYNDGTRVSGVELGTIRLDCCIDPVPKLVCL